MLRYPAHITHILRHAFRSRPRFIISLLVALTTFFALLPYQGTMMCSIPKLERLCLDLFTFSLCSNY